jgi:transcriptional repressor NrdR
VSNGEAKKDEERGVRCPQCNCAHLPVLETRKLPGGRIMRRRECRHCGKRFSTYERAFGTP